MYNLDELKKFFNDDLFATKLLGAEIIEAKENEAICKFSIKKDHQNAKGVVMGGAIFTLADFTFAVATNQNEEYYTVSTTANINYLRPAMGEYLIAKTKIIKDGKTVCFYDVLVYNDKDDLIAKLSISGTHIKK